jgi:magnesium chelatase family protein
LLDRIDLRVEVPSLPSDDLLAESVPADAASTSLHVARRVRRARDLQYQRTGKLNSELSGGEIQEVCGLNRSSRLLLAQARSRFALSARGVHRVLRVARTIADLELTRTENETGPMDQPIEPAHLAEALALRREC